MLRFLSGNLFNSKAQTLVNTVNCVGVMGKGIALAFKERFPAMFADYRRRCENEELQPGILTIYKDASPWVINFPTKRHWRGNSQIKDIEAGLATLVKVSGEWGLQSLAMPALGCGNGGLDWTEVRLLIERYLSGVDIDVEVYEPTPIPGGQIPPVSDVTMPLDLFGQPLNINLKRSGRRKKLG